MWLMKSNVYVCLLSGSAMALAKAGESSGQSSNAATEALRTTITKSSRPTLGPFARISPLDTCSPIQARTRYETIPPGGPCAHSEFSRQLYKRE
jgi:hypothetical protein